MACTQSRSGLRCMLAARIHNRVNNSSLTWLHVRKVHFFLVEDDSDIVCVVLRTLPQLQNNIAAPQSMASGPNAVAYAP